MQDIREEIEEILFDLSENHIETRHTKKPYVSGRDRVEAVDAILALLARRIPKKKEYPNPQGYTMNAKAERKHCDKPLTEKEKGQDE